MPCEYCDCDDCKLHFGMYCPKCKHHIKYHRDGGCAQPTCKCNADFKVSWDVNAMEDKR